MGGVLNSRKKLVYIYYMDKSEKSSLLSNIKDLVEELSEEVSEEYPPEAMQAGTFVRATRLDRLGVITDAFYEKKDKDGKKIITYTILLFPKIDPLKIGTSHLQEDNYRYYITNEYEYEVIGYLMMSPMDLSKVNIHFERELF